MSYDRSSYMTERGNVCCSLWWKICDNSFGDWWIEEVAPTARRVLGGAHPLTKEIEEHLRESRAALRARETP